MPSNNTDLSVCLVCSSDSNLECGVTGTEVSLKDRPCAGQEMSRIPLMHEMAGSVVTAEV